MVISDTTVTCDESIATIAGLGADTIYWNQQNITTLCATGCQSSLASWTSLVEPACVGQTIMQGDLTIQAKALPLSFTYNSGLVCMKDSSNNWCFLESQTWQGSDFIRWEPEMCLEEEEYLPAICKNPDFDIGEVTPAMAAMMNLYEPSLYCSECFLGLYRQRLLNP